MLSLWRRGLTLIEVMVALFIIAVLAAVIQTQVTQSVRGGRSAALAQNLDALRQGIYNYRNDVRRYPTQLTFLSTQPGSATDLCGRTVPPGFLAGWRGPYAQQTITAAGIPVGDARILNALEPDPATFGIQTTGTLFIVVQEVDSLVAAALERAYDGEPITAGAYTSGVIRWTNDAPTSQPRGTLRFGLAISGC